MSMTRDSPRTRIWMNVGERTRTRDRRAIEVLRPADLQGWSCH
jgi:hypothetical protein